MNRKASENLNIQNSNYAGNKLEYLLRKQQEFHQMNYKIPMKSAQNNDANEDRNDKSRLNTTRSQLRDPIIKNLPALNLKELQ